MSDHPAFFQTRVCSTCLNSTAVEDALHLNRRPLTPARSGVCSRFRDVAIAVSETAPFFVVLPDQGHDVGLIRRFGLLSSVDFGYVTSTEVRVDPWTLIQRVK